MKNNLPYLSFRLNLIERIDAYSKILTNKLQFLSILILLIFLILSLILLDCYFLFEFLEAYKNYFFEATKEYGKIFFELYPILINDKKRLKIYARKISSNINFAYWIETLFIYFDKKINERYFNPITTSQNIYMQIVSMLKGIEMELILTKYYNKNRDYKIDLETKLDDLVETIYKTILFLMGSKIKNKEIKKK